MRNRSACIASTWTVDGITIASTACDIFGFIINGSDGGSTITIKDGLATKFVVVAATTSTVPVSFCVPVEFSTSLTVTNSGTGSYSIMFAKRV